MPMTHVSTEPYNINQIIPGDVAVVRSGASGDRWKLVDAGQYPPREVWERGWVEAFPAEGLAALLAGNDVVITHSYTDHYPNGRSAPVFIAHLVWHGVSYSTLRWSHDGGTVGAKAHPEAYNWYVPAPTAA